MKSVAQLWKESPSVVIRIARPRIRSSAATHPVRDLSGPISSLAEKIFFPAGSAQRTRILFVAADDQTDVTASCEQMGRALADYSGARVGIVAQVFSSPANGAKKRAQAAGDSWRSHCAQISEMVWRIPARLFESRNGSGKGEGSVSRELEAGFAYFLVASRLPEARLQTRSIRCDGIVLVLTAHRTRREVALHAIAELEKCEAPLLGAVLDKRTFPVPDAIYRRL